MTHRLPPWRLLLKYADNDNDPSLWRLLMPVTEALALASFISMVLVVALLVTGGR